MTLQALWVAACPDEAGGFFAFLAAAAAAAASRPGRVDLQIMFGVGGERDLTERVLPHLPGWRGSAPVRVGNGAWNQRQLDVYGELLDAAATLPEFLVDTDAGHPAVPCGAADTAAAQWQEPDQGIWESPRRAAALSALQADVLGGPGPRRRPRRPAAGRSEGAAVEARARDGSRAAIREHGWSAAAGAYTQAFGSEDLDASALMLPIVGLPAGQRPRDARHDRRDRGSASPTSGAWSTATGAPTASPARKAPSCCAPSGSPTPWPWPAARQRAREVFERAAGVRQRRRPAGRGGRPRDR